MLLTHIHQKIREIRLSFLFFSQIGGMLGILLWMGCKPTGYQSDLFQKDVPHISAVENSWQMYEALKAESLPQNFDHVAEDIRDYAFHVLTPSGKDLFLRMRHFLVIHKRINKSNAAEHRFADALACAMNVSHVLWGKDLTKPALGGGVVASISAIEEKIKQEGGKVVTLPAPGGYDPSKSVKDQVFQNVRGEENPLIQFFNQEGAYAQTLPPGFFQDGIPPGVVITGYKKGKLGGSTGHSALVGDVLYDGSVMLYHNNWFRPESELSGRRLPYMVSLTNLYHGHQKPREWMATPWIYLSRDSANRVKEIISIYGAIDDLDPLNPSFEIRMSIPKVLLDEMKAQPPSLIAQIRKPKSFVGSETSNVHHVQSDPERNIRVCRLNLDRSQNIYQFFKDNSPPAEHHSATYTSLDQIFNHTQGYSNPPSEHRRMELYLHNNRNDSYQQDYERVSFFRAKKNKQASPRVFLSLFKKTSVS